MQRRPGSGVNLLFYTITVDKTTDLWNIAAKHVYSSVKQLVVVRFLITLTTTRSLQNCCTNFSFLYDS